MATAWFKFNPPGFPPNPFTNPLSYTLYAGTPVPPPNPGMCVAFIFAETQVIGGVVRPTIGSSSPVGAVTINEINVAITIAASSTNCYVIICGT